MLSKLPNSIGIEEIATKIFLNLIYDIEHFIKSESIKLFRNWYLKETSAKLIQKVLSSIPFQIFDEFEDNQEKRSLWFFENLNS